MNYLYLFEIAGVLLAALGATFFCRKTKAISPMWDAFRLPLKIYIWFSSLVFSIKIFEQNFSEVQLFFSSWIENAYRGGGIALFLWAFLRFINRFEERLYATRATNHDQTKTRGIIRLLKIVAFTLCGLGILQWFGIPLSGVIAFGGVGGIAAGFAAKDLLANLFGGAMIFMDHHFEIGDWIRSPDRNIEGIVEHIGWRITKVRTLDQRPLYIPNSVLSTIALENPGRMSHRRIKANIGLSYEDYSKVGPILSEIENLLKNHPKIDASSTYFANLVDFSPHALDILICAFTKTTDGVKFQRIQQEIFLSILNIIQNHDAKVARYPLLNIEQETL